MKINPRCKQDFAQVYVDTEGYVMPCCWIGNQPFIQSYYSLYKNQLEQMNINHLELDEILQSSLFSKIEESWDSESPFKPCAIMCKRTYNEESKQKLKGDNLTNVFDLKRKDSSDS